MRFLKSANRTQEQSNYFHLVMDVVWFGLALPATARFLSVYAIHLGADATQLTWLASAPALVLLISASLGTWWINRFPSSDKSNFWPALGFRLIFLLPALTPFLPHDFQITWLILSLALPAFPQGLASVSFLVMFREAIHEKQIAPLLSHRSIAMNLTVAISGLAFGFWLEKAPFPINYQAMYVVAFALTLISFWHVISIRVPPVEKVATTTKSSPLKVWLSPSFQSVALVIGLTHVTFFSIAALVPLHLVDNLGANEGFMGLFALAELAASVGIALFTRQISERVGNRAMIALAMVGTATSAFLIAASSNLTLVLIAAAIGGASWTAASIGIFAFFSESTPSEDKTAFTTAYNQMVFISVFVGPIIGKLLNGAGLPLVTIIMIGGALRLIAGTLAQFRPREWRLRASNPASPNASVD